MYSRTGLLFQCMTMPTYRNHRVPSEEIKYFRDNNSRSQIKMLKHANKKRARRIDYNLILGFE